MRRRTRAGMAALAAGSVAALVVGCVPVNAGSAAADRFEAEVRADHGDWVEEFRVSAHNTLPFLGGASGSVVLRADTPTEVFADVLELVESSSVRNFDGSGVEANGVGVCIGDPQAAAKQQLRDALHAAGETLAGAWPCPPRPDAEPLAYTGAVDGFGSDIALLRSLGAATGLELTASLTAPSGTVSGPLDEVPDTAAAALLAIGAVSEVIRFELVGPELTVAVAPTADPAPAQAAADAVAGGDLVVRVVVGSLDPDEQERFAELAPLVDALRAVPGVDHVEASTGEMTLRTRDAQQVRAIHDAALAEEGFVDLALAIEVGEGDWTMGASRYWLPAGAESRHLDGFVAVLTAEGVTQVALNEAGVGRELWLSVHVETPILEVVELKGVLPTGVNARFLSSVEDVSLGFVIADRLGVDDLHDWRDEVDLEAFAAAWNAAP